MMKRRLRIRILTVLAAVTLVAAGMVLTAEVASAQNAPCNPSVRTCL
jgi:hypothetical protein